MNVALRQRMTREQFLEWEERQPVKYEFDGFRPVAMNGVTRAHARIEVNLTFTLNGRLAGKPCEVFGSNLKIAVGRSFRYPDAFIVCTPGPGETRVIDDPVIVFEILSQSTATTVRTIKNLEYRATPSIQRYVMLEQTAVSATVFTRDGEAWRSTAYGPRSVLAMPEAGIEVPLDDLYEGLTFTD
jgi:Uma2 family endonuclease